jgi:hypothetical protein
MSPQLSSSDEQRFAEDLPFWSNGTLSVQDAQWMQACLDAHPELLRDVNEVQRQMALSQTAQWLTPEDVRLQRLRDELQGGNKQGTTTDAPSIRPIDRPPTGSATTAWWRPWLNVLGGGVLGVGLALSTPSLWQRPGEMLTTSPQFRGERPPCNDLPGVRAVFKPNMPWSAQVQLLRSLQLNLVHGPNEDGEVWLRAPLDTPMAQTLTLLRNNPWVEQAFASQVQPPGTCQR